MLTSKREVIKYTGPLMKYNLIYDEIASLNLIKIVNLMPEFRKCWGQRYTKLLNQPVESAKSRR